MHVIEDRKPVIQYALHNIPEKVPAEVSTKQTSEDYDQRIRERPLTENEEVEENGVDNVVNGEVNQLYGIGNRESHNTKQLSIQEFPINEVVNTLAG